MLQIQTLFLDILSDFRVTEGTELCLQTSNHHEEFRLIIIQILFPWMNWELNANIEETISAWHVYYYKFCNLSKSTCNLFVENEQTPVLEKMKMESECLDRYEQRLRKQDQQIREMEFKY